jgi:uncharacterized membrane protein YraQ (UPF0718 family)
MAVLVCRAVDTGACEAWSSTDPSGVVRVAAGERLRRVLSGRAGLVQARVPAAESPPEEVHQNVPADASGPGKAGLSAVEVLAVLLIVLVVLRGRLAGWTPGGRLQTWMTVFVSVLVQAVPFLVFGVVLSAAIAVFVPRAFWARALPAHPMLAVPVASVAGVVLPGCECGSVPIAGSLIRQGVTPAAALAFLLAAPAINPIVLTATAIAFPNNPRMVLARGVAGLLVAVLMGWLWLRLGKTDWVRLPHRSERDDASRGRAFWAACRHDVMHAGGFLVIGAAAAATINVLVPERWLAGVAGKPVWSVLALAVLAVLLSICSEADAFVAASLSQFSLTARLVFLTVGPMVDLKLISMQTAMLGPRLAARFAPATFLMAIGIGVGVGMVLL